MNASEKLNLKNLIRDYKHESTTDKIRELKHSGRIREEITKMMELKKKYTRIDKSNLRTMAEKQCSFYMQTIQIFLIKFLKITLI